MNEITSKYEAFLRAARHHVYNKDNAKKIAQNYPPDGCSTTYIYNIINEQNPKPVSEKVQSKFAQACGYNNLQGFIDSVDIQTVDVEDTETLRHIDVIKRFKNKSLARKINEKMVELERLDDFSFAEIVVEINNKLREVKERHPPPDGTYDER